MSFLKRKNLATVLDVETERFVRPLVPMGSDEERIRLAIRDILATIPNCLCEHTVNAHHRTQKQGVKGFFDCGAVACACLVYVPDNLAAQGKVINDLTTQNKALSHMLQLTTEALNEERVKVRGFERALSDDDDYQAEAKTKAIVNDFMNDAVRHTGEEK